MGGELGLWHVRGEAGVRKRGSAIRWGEKGLGSKAPVCKVSVPKVPVSKVPVSKVPVSKVRVPKAPLPQSPAPQSPAPQSPGLHSPGPQSPADLPAAKRAHEHDERRRPTLRLGGPHEHRRRVAAREVGDVGESRDGQSVVAEELAPFEKEWDASQSRLDLFLEEQREEWAEVDARTAERQRRRPLPPL